MLVDKEVVIKIALNDNDIEVLTKAKDILKQIKETIGEECPDTVSIGDIYSNNDKVALETFEGLIDTAYQLNDYIYVRECDE